MANLPLGAPQQQQKVSPDSIVTFHINIKHPIDISFSFSAQFYKFSPEETQVMKDCNRESFFQRSLPLAILGGVGSFMGVNAGK